MRSIRFPNSVPSSKKAMRRVILIESNRQKELITRKR